VKPFSVWFSFPSFSFPRASVIMSPRPLGNEIFPASPREFAAANLPSYFNSYDPLCLFCLTAVLLWFHMTVLHGPLWGYPPLGSGSRLGTSLHRLACACFLFLLDGRSAGRRVFLCVFLAGSLEGPAFSSGLAAFFFNFVFQARLRHEAFRPSPSMWEGYCPAENFRSLGTPIRVSACGILPHFPLCFFLAF